MDITNGNHGQSKPGLNPAAHISPEEWAVRVDLAACYRLIAHFGWDDLVLTHNTARVPGTTDQMLINPSGLMFDEITASNLLKVDITDGHLIEPSEYEPINAGVVIHGAIYLARPDVRVRHPHPYRGRYRGRRARRGAVAVVAMGDAVLWQARLSRLRGRLARHGRARAAGARHRPASGAGIAQPRPAGDRAQCRRGVLADVPFRALGRGAAENPGGRGGGSKLVVPSPETCERQAAQFTGNMPRLQGQREWPALLRLCDRLDPAIGAETCRDDCRGWPVRQSGRRETRGSSPRAKAEVRIRRVRQRPAKARASWLTAS